MEPLIFKSKSWWKSEWDLYRGEQLVGSLRMRKKMSYALAEISIGEKRWEIGYKGWNANRIFLRDSAGTLAEAVPRSRWSWDADITIGGQQYGLESNWWQTVFTAIDGSGTQIMQLKPKWWSGGAEVIPLQPAETDDMLLLACILFYRYKLLEMSTAAAGGTVVVLSS